MPGDGKYYDRFRLLTVFNLSEETVNFKIGFEKNSIFKSNPNQKFETVRALFYTDHENIYCIFSPDQQLYTYNFSNSFELRTSFTLTPDPKLFQGEVQTPNLYEKILRSSSYNNLIVDGGRTLLSYFSGIKKENIPSEGVSNLDVINELTAKYKNSYLSIYEDGQKMGADILLPSKVASLICPLGNNRYLATPHSGRVESKDKALFYICTLSNKE
jgi:hypothetical protein